MSTAEEIVEEPPLRRTDPIRSRRVRSIAVADGHGRGMVGFFEVSTRERDDDPHVRALAIAALCVGGLVVARAVDDSELASTLRDATRRAAFELGGWTDGAPTPHKETNGKSDERRGRRAPDHARAT